MPSRRTLAAVAAAASAVVAGAAILVVVAVAGDGPTERERSRAAADRPCRPPYVEDIAVSLDDVGLGGLALEPVGRAEEPTAVAVDPRGEAPPLLAERTGAVRVLGDDGTPGGRVLDLRDTSDHGDGGLLNLAFDPDGGWLYVLRTTVDQDDVLEAFPLDGAGLPTDQGRVELLRSGHPDSEQHHGGGLVFGSDGMLYVGLGDGGGLGDPRGNARNPSTLLGKVLRIDPTPGEPEPYAVPPDNPFVGRDGWRPEIWAYGVRNPYRMTVDHQRGELWLGDVGQSCWEEINRLGPDDAGADLGWDRYEGTEAFEPGDVDEPTVWPVHTYSHLAGWCALVTGPMVRGGALDGWLLHTDYCGGRLMLLRPAEGRTPRRLVDTGLRVERPVAVVAGPDGFPWVLSLDGGILRVVPR